MWNLEIWVMILILPLISAEVLESFISVRLKILMADDDSVT